VHLRGVEQAPERLLAAALVALRGVQDLGPAAVVEGDEQRDAVVARRLRLRPVHLLEQRRGHALAAPDEAHAHALGVQLRGLAEDSLGEHAHQRRHLLGGP
jgi:hypothetical protein